MKTLSTSAKQIARRAARAASKAERFIKIGDVVCLKSTPYTNYSTITGFRREAGEFIFTMVSLDGQNTYTATLDQISK